MITNRVFFLSFFICIAISCNTKIDKGTDPNEIDSTVFVRPTKSNSLVTWESLSKNPRWVNFHNESVYFYLSGTTADDIFEPSKLLVIIPASSHLQTIHFMRDELLWEKREWNSFAKMIDVNLDGFEDLLLFNGAGATGNTWYSAWLFDSTTYDFVYSSEYSDLCCLSVTKDKKMVKSYWRNGFYDDTVWYYKPDCLHTPILLKKVFSDPENNYPNGFKCWKVTVEKIKGKWVETQRVVRTNGLYEEEFMVR